MPNPTYLFKNATHGYLVTWTKEGDIRHWKPEQFEEAERYMEDVARNRNIYFSLGLQQQALTSGRGTSETVVAIPGLFMDIDLKSDDPRVHAKKALPNTFEEVLQFFQECGIPSPTRWVHSGNGLYAHWLFQELADLRDMAERQKMMALSRGWQQMIRQLAKEKYGWDLDNTSDLARVTRMPGTFNHKTVPPKPVTLIEEFKGPYYTPDELAAKAAELGPAKSKAVAKRAPTQTIKSAPIGSEKPKRLPDWGQIELGCAWARHVATNADKLSEPEWYASLSIIGKCQDGAALAHQLSSPYPNYDRDETDDKLEHAVEYPPRTCENIHTEVGFDGCKDCPFRFNPNMSSPIALGYQPAEIVQLARDHAFDLQSRRHFNLRTGEVLSDRAFSDKYSHLFAKGTPHAIMMKSKIACKLDGVDYVPGVDDLFITDADGRLILNTWKPGPLKPEKGNCQDILDHIAYLIPDFEVRKHILDALANLLQKPAVKLRHTILIIGNEGTGKTLLSEIIGRMVGDQNILSVHGNRLNSNFNAYLANIQVLNIEELYTFDGGEVANNFKLSQSEEWTQVEQKHVPTYVARTPRFILALSNFNAPVRVTGNGRRWLIYRSPAAPRSQDYYSKMFGPVLEEQVSAFMAYLMDRDISHFNPAAPPPMTTAKQELLNLSRPQPLQHLEEMVSEEVAPFHRDLVTAPEVEVALRERVGRSASIREVTEALRGIGAVQLKQVRLDGIRPRLWAIRNSERWSVATPEEKLEEWRRPFFPRKK